MYYSNRKTQWSNVYLRIVGGPRVLGRSKPDCHQVATLCKIQLGIPQKPDFAAGAQIFSGTPLKRHHNEGRLKAWANWAQGLNLGGSFVRSRLGLNKIMNDPDNFNAQILFPYILSPNTGNFKLHVNWQK
ncbi:hypothetical protein TNCV_1131751 [Trichonephila clavipes]|nr:hypothetical protein TNCV_1131751 [Trichonephila clavipes]